MPGTAHVFGTCRHPAALFRDGGEGRKLRRDATIVGGHEDHAGKRLLDPVQPHDEVAHALVVDVDPA